ncbi:uncharacterized protein LOC121383526 isoform X2 [Gigantopelta aegis]|uniref:uncharacterized protein LOC121383526 isoform X2 n=1 Tax=Gigantopelta aegis TaxID=1735272 RepID=UPI001B889489|nr:uncharacterized protein LOC121383526 isoform X2 [Gigantopelta aegis]
MEKQYSVKFFASFLEALQKVCRDFVDFDDSIELSGYLSLEIDNVKKERYVLSEMLNSSGNVISESYCTKAFKTVRKYQQPSGRENITPRSQTISNRSQAFISESQNQNSSSSMFNYKDHTPDSRMSKQWSQDMYGTNSHMSPLRGSGQQFGDGVGIHGMKSSNQKRSLSTIVIDDPPSNKRGRSDSVPDDKLLSETSSQHGTCKLDTDAMQATFSNSSQSQSTTHLPTTSSSLQHQTNNSIASHSSSQPASESIRLPLPVTIKDEPDIPCVDIDLSELDSADSMGGSDSGSGYPSQEGTSGPYRMAEGSHGAHDQYQVDSMLPSMGIDPAAIPLSSLVDDRNLLEAEMRARSSRDPAGTLLNLLIDLVFSPTELANSNGLGLRFRHSEDPNKKPLDPAKVDAIKDYVQTVLLREGWEQLSSKKLNKKFTNKVCHARRDLRHGHISSSGLGDAWT